MTMTAVVTAPPTFGEISADRGVGVGDRFVDEIAVSRDEVLTTHGKGDLVLYERLMRDDQVMPTFARRRISVVAREMKVDPGGDQPIDKEAADFMVAQFKRVSWDRTTYKMLAGLMHGYGVGECMFSLEENPAGGKTGRVLLDAIKVRRAQRFVFDGAGRLRLVREGTPELMPPQKFWTFTAGAEDDDDFYGRGLGHWLYWPVWFKRNVIKFWTLFLERFSAPTPVATAPAGATKAETDKLLTFLDALIQGGKIVIPKGVELELLQSTKDSGGDYDKFIARTDGQIAKIILTQTMTTDAANTGLGSTQGEVQERGETMLVKGDSDLLTESFMQGPATWLTQWNFPGAKTPIIYRDFSASQDLTGRATRDKLIFDMGFGPTDEYIAETYGDGYERIQAPAAGPPMLGPAFAEPPRDASEAIQDLVGGDGWRKVMGPEVARIESMLAGARSLDDVRDRLGELALADPAQLVDGLSRVMFAAHVQGQVAAEDTDDTDPTKGGAA